MPKAAKFLFFLRLTPQGWPSSDLAYARPLSPGEGVPVGKSFAIHIEAEKSGFCKYGQVAAIYEEILISVCWWYIIQLGKQFNK